MEMFKEVLSKECPFKLSDEMMDVFCASMDEIRLKRYDLLIKSGEFDSNIYIVKEGILRRAHQVGDKMVTKSFASSGSVLMSWHCYFQNLPSFSSFEACCNSVVMRVTKERFDELVVTSHEFSQWALSIANATLYLGEFRDKVINGNVKERYLNLIKSRHDVMKDVPLGFIASYLGITQSHLSRIRKELLYVDPKSD